MWLWCGHQGRQSSRPLRSRPTAVSSTYPRWYPKRLSCPTTGDNPPPSLGEPILGWVKREAKVREGCALTASFPLQRSSAARNDSQVSCRVRVDACLHPPKPDKPRYSGAGVITHELQRWAPTKCARYVSNSRPAHVCSTAHAYGPVQASRDDQLTPPTRFLHFTTGHSLLRHLMTTSIPFCRILRSQPRAVISSSPRTASLFLEGHPVHTYLVKRWPHDDDCRPCGIHLPWLPNAPPSYLFTTLLPPPSCLSISGRHPPCP